MEEALQQLRKLDLPPDQFAIFGSGPMVIRGLKRFRDLDVFVYDEIFEKLKKKYSENYHGKKIILGQVEIMPESRHVLNNAREVIRRADIFDGIRFVNLSDTIAWKKKYGREKDLEDVKIIKKYLKDNKKDNYD